MDLISRKKIIDEIKRYRDENDKNILLYESCNYILDIIDTILSQNQWIPCSERLPEDDTLVLVTVKVGNREPKVRSGYYYKDGHFHIDNGDSWEARDEELKAWMLLPKPYTESEEEICR